MGGETNLRVRALATGSLLWQTRDSLRTNSSGLDTFPRCFWLNWNTCKMCSLSRLAVDCAEKMSASLRRAVLVITENGNLSINRGHFTIASHCSPTTLLLRPNVSDTRQLWEEESGDCHLYQPQLEQSWPPDECHCLLLPLPLLPF